MRYLSKVYSDNWMRENGFLEPEVGLGTVAELLAHKGRVRELVTVAPATKVTEAIGVLKVHGISQLPVVDKDRVIGMLHESRLLEKALAGTRGDAAVQEIAEATWCTVDERTDISVLTELFKRFKVALVISNSKPVDIITRIDLIDYIAKVTAQAKAGAT
jgi:cystathionine beta-synthase